MTPPTDHIQESPYFWESFLKRERRFMKWGRHFITRVTKPRMPSPRAYPPEEATLRNYDYIYESPHEVSFIYERDSLGLPCWWCCYLGGGFLWLFIISRSLLFLWQVFGWVVVCVCCHCCGVNKWCWPQQTSLPERPLLKVHWPPNCNNWSINNSRRLLSPPPLRQVMKKAY